MVLNGRTTPTKPVVAYLGDANLLPGWLQHVFRPVRSYYSGSVTGWENEGLRIASIRVAELAPADDVFGESGRHDNFLRGLADARCDLASPFLNPVGAGAKGALNVKKIHPLLLVKVLPLEDEQLHLVERRTKTES